MPASRSRASHRGKIGDDGQAGVKRAVELVVCNGKDCRSSKGYTDLLDLAAGVHGSRIVTCQGICHGPVVGVRLAGEQIRWYQRVRGKHSSMLRRLVTTGAGRKRLRAAEVRSKRGRVRRPHHIAPLRR